MNIDLTNTVITKSEFYGVLLNCTGSVAITKCAITENTHNLLNNCYGGCRVVVDGVPVQNTSKKA